MDIFSRQKLFIRTIVALVILNIVLIALFILKETKPGREPLLFPKNEQYKDVTHILFRQVRGGRSNFSNLTDWYL